LIFSLSLIIVSLAPGLLNKIAGILFFDREHYGRIFSLLIFSNVFIWFVLFYLKIKIDNDRYKFDLLIRNLSYYNAGRELIHKINGKEIVIIIPAYNEADNLKDILKRIPKYIKNKEVGVVVIDDGSTDDTSDIVIESGHTVVKNIINRGQGGASRLGYDILVRNKVKIGVTMDADGQHLPEEISRLIEPILDNKHDLVLGSRVLGQHDKISFMRARGIAILTRLINFLTGLRLTDCSSGFKAFKVRSIEALCLREEQFQAAEIIIEAAKKGLKIGEVPVTILERQHGTTKKGKDIKYGIGFTKSIFKSWWRT
jgi:glycosyltransferase involved in cell wall biosynthesis